MKFKNKMSTMRAKVALASIALVGSGSAMASDLTALETGILAKITAVEAFGWTLLVAFLLASIGIKVAKKFAQKAT